MPTLGALFGRKAPWLNSKSRMGMYDDYTEPDVYLQADQIFRWEEFTFRRCSRALNPIMTAKPGPISLYFPDRRHIGTVDSFFDAWQCEIMNQLAVQMAPSLQSVLPAFECSMQNFRFGHMISELYLENRTIEVPDWGMKNDQNWFVVGCTIDDYMWSTNQPRVRRGAREGGDAADEEESELQPRLGARWQSVPFHSHGQDRLTGTFALFVLFLGSLSHEDRHICDLETTEADNLWDRLRALTEMIA
ncbi:Uu.00g127490.m01.CDS01 [Anthostomella pinea]|uniref:Uu.00g127490.m01.CDS01 n=1 Tax=Anthostomella pinea TaxID=933095 RepID=A0AAI8YHS8_9PEZI|nr:Uu.00g127490.m01.CDS01 [Anthostomella pinea]